jgi:4-cresol dehydrogenase (hydroxylating)
MTVNPSHQPEESTATRAAARLGPALAVLTDLLGATGVRTEPPVLDRYARSSGSRTSRPAAVLYPASTPQVQDIVRTAARFRLTLYPVSRGCNWGYGDAAPFQSAELIVDLRRMDQIHEFNHELGYVTLGPGVSQGQLHHHLLQHAPDLWMDCSAAGPDASIVGNIMERGFGHTRYCDHVRTTAGLEVVLPDGRLLHTGFGHFPGSRTTHVFPYGIGPQLDSLFMQSNLGIVTRATVWLMPRPDAFDAVVVSCREDQLEAMVDALGRLRRAALLNTTVHLGNDLRVISGRMRYPFHRAAGQVPLPPELRAQIREEFDIDHWNASAAIYGAASTVHATRRAIADALRPFRVNWFNQSRLDLGRRVTRLLHRTAWARRTSTRIDAAQTALDLLMGKPTDAPLTGAAWRVRGEIPEPVTDPLDAHAGLMWIAPVVPLTGSAAREIVTLLEPIFNRFGFDFLVTFTLINERAMIAVTNLAFDRRDEAETARADLCYHEALNACLRAGFPPYRVGPEGTADITRHRSSFWDIVDELKTCLDPLSTLSRGRYARPT